jgi:hypothetical protein
MRVVGWFGVSRVGRHPNGELSDGLGVGPGGRWAFFAPAAPSHSRPFWGLRPQAPAVGLDGLVLKRRTGWMGLARVFSLSGV